MASLKDIVHHIFEKRPDIIKDIESYSGYNHISEGIKKKKNNNFK